MNSQEKNIIKKEILQVKEFLKNLRGHNEIINEQLALLILVGGKVRTSYLEIDRLITEFESKLTKSP